MKKYLFVLLFLMSCVRVVPFSGGTFYVAPGGSGTACTSAAPCAFSRISTPGVAQAGDIWFLKDGTYGTGLQLNCSTGGVNSGISGQPITIMAENERRAFIDTGGFYAFQINACSYWVIQGLHMRQGNNAGVQQDFIWLTNGAHHITLRRNLIREINKTAGPPSGLSAVLMYSGTPSHDLTMEENEIYDCWANCINMHDNASNNIFRRNYFNNLNKWDTGLRGTSAIAGYPSSNNILENNICEGNSQNTTGDGSYCWDIEPLGDTTNNRFYGNIALNSAGSVVALRDSSTFATNHLVKDDVLITSINTAATIHAWFFGNAPNLSLSNMTVINGGASQQSGILISGSTAVNSFTLTNSRVQGFNNVGNGAVGVYVTGGQSSCSIDSVSSSGNVTPFSTANCSTNNLKTATPINLHNCYLWIPSDSDLYQAGATGSGDSKNLGATILYAYENGALTTKKLWNPDGSPTFAGATVPGVNDGAANLKNIQNRLNINTNGCSFPSGYGSNVTVTITTPTTNPTFSTNSSSVTIGGTSSLP